MITGVTGQDGSYLSEFLIEKVAFPGYFFIDSDMPKELLELLDRIPTIVTPVRIGGEFHPIKEEKVTILEQMMDENDVILASIGNVINGKLIVDKGHLKDRKVE